MITITQNKIAGFEPRWAPFPGFSLLFDNPGAATARCGSLEKVTCVPSPDGELELYYLLSKTLEAIGRDALITSFLLCPLPPSSYHVTVWDGINVDNAASLHQELRSDWSEFLLALPDSLHRLPRTMSVVTASSLVSDAFGKIAFRFDELTIWGDQVLAARLAPADEVSSRRLNALAAARAVLGTEAKRRLGIDTRPGYSPHVTVGYFSNRECGRLAHGHLSEWADRFREALANSSITFSSLDLYVFTDMINFYRRAGSKSTIDSAA